MHLIQQILFILLTILAIYIFAKNAGKIRRNILLGRDEDLSGNTAQRWKNVLLISLGQKKMFKKPLPAVLHFLVYAGFIIINIEILEIVLDGVFGTHRLFAPYLGNFYTFTINFFEILAFLVLSACVIFLLRRNLVKVRRLTMGELKGWPKDDANYILIFEVVLMSLFLVMNASDKSLQIRHYGHYGDIQTANFLVSGFITPIFHGFSDSSVVWIERGAWWVHIAGVFFFLNYLPFSKHLHVILAFPNTYYMRLRPQGEMRNMQEIQNEVLYMMQPELAPAAPPEGLAPSRFGAKDIMDLSWKHLLEAYSCTECGRCTAACPANITGKKLSPRKIMMDTRDRMEEVGRNIEKNGSFVEDGKSLIHDYITVEELRACTTCQACVESCPVGIEPLSIIDQLRRYLIMEESNAPQEWNLMSSNIENNMAPWKFSPDERDKWVEEV
jgi:ferredoxin